MPVMRHSSWPRIASPNNFVSCEAWMKERCTRHAEARFLSDAPRTQGCNLCSPSRAICVHLLIYGMQTKLPSRPGTKAAKCVDFRCAATASFRCMRRLLPPPIIKFSPRSRPPDAVALPLHLSLFHSGLLLKQSAATTACAARTRHASLVHPPPPPSPPTSTFETHFVYGCMSCFGLRLNLECSEGCRIICLQVK
jgi:hypothetical protein